MSPSPLSRFITRFLLALLVAAAAACEAATPTGFSSDIDDLLARGDAYARSLVERPESRLVDEDVIALGYLERARLGIGSPFRLIAYARRDARLSRATQQHLSYALLTLTLQRRGYQIDPAVLDVLRLMGVPRGSSLGEHHLHLIERTIADAASATSGERAVRLGYMLAGTERTVDASPDPVVGYVAAAVSDRRRAADDATDLLRSAAQFGADPLELLEVWRRELRFQVERPALFRASLGEEMIEADRGTGVAASLRTLAQRMSAGSSRPSGALRVRGTDFWSRGWLTAEVAARLQRLAAEHDYPAQPPIAVPVSINREPLLARAGLTAEQRQRRALFADFAINEEKLVAANAVLGVLDAGRGPRLSLILLQSAVFMRNWNQEDPWFPGDAAPSSRDLETRFGLASVAFGAEVPDAWRPYYRLTLGRALADLQRVLPTASLRGLRVLVDVTPVRGAALALHDPRSRTLILPPTSGAGTIAHEIAHDLDWQLARKRYGRRGAYASDLAVLRQKGDRLATSLAGLTASFARDGPNPESSAHERRPAEVFARGMDWLIAVHLASEGRSGGYLTSYQDAAIPGYGSSRGPHVDGHAIPALLAILDQIAPVTAETRQWALDNHGPTRTLTAKELVRAITTASRDGDAFHRLASLEEARDRALDGLSAASCQMTPSPEARRLIATRQQVIRTTVAAAARGIVIDGVRAIAPLLYEPPTQADLDEFLLWRLDGAPEPEESSVHLLQPAADELILRAATLAQDPVPSNGGFMLNPERTLCGGNPFASARNPGRDALFPTSRAAR